jgi:hypothetical protein
MSALQDDDIINKFREMIDKRYDYADLQQRFTLPPSVDETVVAEIKDYFLNTIYPEASERRKLEEAFAELAGYMRQPRKIWGLFGNMAAAVFRFGRHFVAALRAGMAALDSFIGAKKFERSMAELANKLGIEHPMTDDGFEECLYQLPREEVENFIHDVKGLFGAMVNTTLLEKTLHILDNVVITMEKHPHTYPGADVDGIRLGRALLQRGYDIFIKYDEPTRMALVDLIARNELWFVEQVYLKKEAR